MPHNGDTDGRNISTAVRNWDSSVDFGTSSNTYSLVKALLEEAERIDGDLTDVYHSQHIDTATGENLDQFGSLVNTPRETDEPDDKYRARIKAEFAQSRTGTDFNDFVEFCSTVLNTDVSNLFFSTNYDGNPGTVTLSAEESVYQNVALTGPEIVDLLDGAVPAGHEVEAKERGTFRLKVDGEIDTAKNGLTSDSISTGGTLAADVI